MHLEPILPNRPLPIWADGFDGQENELEDVHEGKLDPPTDDEGPGSIVEDNTQDQALLTADEDDEDDLPTK